MLQIGLYCILLHGIACARVCVCVVMHADSVLSSLNWITLCKWTRLNLVTGIICIGRIAWILKVGAYCCGSVKEHYKQNSFWKVWNMRSYRYHEITVVTLGVAYELLAHYSIKSGFNKLSNLPHYLDCWRLLVAVRRILLIINARSSLNCSSRSSWLKVD